MKVKTILLIGFLMFGYSVKATNAIPTPIFYKISKILLTETQEFVGNSESKSTKVRTTESRRLTLPLKCQPRAEQKFTDFGVLGVKK